MLAYLFQHQVRSELPTRSEASTAESSTGARHRARSETPALSWPADWSIDKTALRKALKGFEKSTRHILWYIDEVKRPPSTGSTPEPATPATESTSEADSQSQSRVRETTDPTTPPSSPSQLQNRNQQQPPIMDQAQLQQMITAAVTAAIRALPQQQPGQQGPPGPPGPPGPAGTGTGGGTERWHAGDVGFFDPMYDGKSAVTGNLIEHAGKDTYFRDVHLFVERAKDVATTKGEELVRQNLYTCFRGVALAWYTGMLTEDQKRLVKLGKGPELILNLRGNLFDIDQHRLADRC